MQTRMRVRVRVQMQTQMRMEGGQRGVGTAERDGTRLLWRAELGHRAVEHVQVVEEVDGCRAAGRAATVTAMAKETCDAMQPVPGGSKRGGGGRETRGRRRDFPGGNERERAA